jgi:hypothetical protein
MGAGRPESILRTQKLPSRRGGLINTGSQMSSRDEHYSWVIRTNCSDDKIWSAICDEIRAPQTELEFRANVNFIEDAKYAGLDCDDVVHALPDNYPGFLCFLVDLRTMSNNEHPVLVVYFAPESVEEMDYQRVPSKTPAADIGSFRAIPSAIQAVENNLSISNMDFEDFVDARDEDGVFRGFGD